MNGMNEALSTMPANQGGHCNCTQQGRAGRGSREEQEELLQLVARCVWLVNALCGCWPAAGWLRGTRCGQQHVWGAR